jgi:3-oxoadipate enol-lactonase
LIQHAKPPSHHDGNSIPRGGDASKQEKQETSMLLTLDRRRLYFDLIGRDEAPVVCLTHSLASDSGMWADQVPSLLDAGFRVLRMDMRGHGGSDAVAGDYTMGQLAADVVAVIDAAGIERVHYIGLSIGGMIGQALAIHHRSRLDTMMLCDTSSAAAEAAKPIWAQRINAVREAGSLAPLADLTIERYLTQTFKERHPTRWRQLRDTLLGTAPEAYIGCGAALQNYDFRDALPTLDIPALIVCGALDPGTPPAENRKIAALIPGARYEEIADALHFPNVERPAMFNEIMLGWLRSHRGR